MSKTVRKHWYYGRNLKDGFFNKSYPKHAYYTKKNKAPPFLPEELECDYENVWWYWWEELNYCPNCGQIQHPSWDFCPC